MGDTGLGWRSLAGSLDLGSCFQVWCGWGGGPVPSQHPHQSAGSLGQEALWRPPHPVAPGRVAASPVGAEDGLAGHEHMAGMWERDGRLEREPVRCVPKQSCGAPVVLHVCQVVPGGEERGGRSLVGHLPGEFPRWG